MTHSTNIEAGRAYMKRALQLSEMGGSRVSPNPFVGAVIVAGGAIIGEGYHRRYGEAHAEVNAVASVSEADRPLLRHATMYVTLEPCSHFGKTPPCADLILREGIPRVVIAAPDPFLKDYESGIDRLRNAGVEVEVGLLREEAEWINRRFFTAHIRRRPFILLKWAQSSDGFISRRDGSSVTLSTPFTQMLMHRERAYYDAILVGTNTVLLDNPQLSCRLWPMRDADHRPLKITFGSPRLSGLSYLEQGPLIKKDEGESLEVFLKRLYSDYKITSLMVEGGSNTLQSFLDEDLFDELRIESSPLVLTEGIPAPDYQKAAFENGFRQLHPLLYGSNSITCYIRPIQY